MPLLKLATKMFYLYLRFLVGESFLLASAAAVEFRLGSLPAATIPGRFLTGDLTATAVFLGIF